MTHLISLLINHEAVCRTAPATPGLLNTSDRQGRSWCQCSCQEERLDPGQWPGRRRGRGREMPTSSSTPGVKVF